MNYDWQAALVFTLSVIAISIIGKKLVFLHPELQRMRSINREQDKLKLAQDKYPPVVAQNNKIGLITNLLFFALVVPFFVSLSAQPWYWVVLDIIAILMVYDFFYYLTHRFLFHGSGYLRRVHGLHHQARKPTHIDAFYVHPVETAIGIFLFMVTIPLLALGLGEFHVVSVIVAYQVFIQLNTINHTYVDLPGFGFRTLSWITAKHAVHHENMHKGNYATITLLYDRIFGTLD